MTLADLRRRISERMPCRWAILNLAFAFAATASLANNYQSVMSHVRTLVILLIIACSLPLFRVNRPPSWTLGIAIGLLPTLIYDNVQLATVLSACFVVDQWIQSLIEARAARGKAASSVPAES